MQMRSRVLMDTSTQGLHRLTGNTASPALGDRIAALYGGALAASLLKDHARAERQVALALQLAAGATPRDAGAERVLRLLQAQVLLVAGDANGALLVLDGIERGQTQRPVLLLRATGGTGASPRRCCRRCHAAGREQRAAPGVGGRPCAGRHGLGTARQCLRGPAASGCAPCAPAPRRASPWATSAAPSTACARHRTCRAQPAGQDFIEASVIDSRLRTISSQRRQLIAEMRASAGPNRATTRTAAATTVAGRTAPARRMAAWEGA